MPLTDRRPLPTIWEVVLAALLHDIGKLYQRAAPHPLRPEVRERTVAILPLKSGKDGPAGIYTHWHALWTDSFFDWAESEGSHWPEGVDRRWVRDLAVHHHNPLQAYPRDPGRLTTWLVTLADRLASGAERKPADEAKETEAAATAGETSRTAFRRTPLRAQMATIRLKSGARNECLPASLLPAELSAQALLPRRDLKGADVEQSYAALWQAFQEGWSSLAATPGQRPEDFEEGLLALLERTTWAVPSSTVDEPDISLHDHSRAVAAFAAALYHHHRDELTDEAALRDGRRAKFRFLVGDLSGLQATLFRLASESVDGLNRILRGRSARFGLIADAAARQALAEFDMPFSAALQTAGGRFLLLLPDLGEEEMARRRDSLRATFDEWLASQYFGDLGLGLALSEPFAPHDLTARPEEADRAPAEKRAGIVRDRLRLAVETAKLRQLEGPAEQAVFKVDYPAGACAACGMRPALDDDDRRCAACAAEHEIGQELPHAQAVVVRRAPDARSGILGLDYTVSRQPEKNPASGWRLPGPDDDGAFPVARRSGRAYVALVGADELDAIHELEDHGDVKEGNIKTFAFLASKSVEEVDRQRFGREMLALLKADVDRLGQIFTRGLGAGWSLARIAALSRMIDGYFSIRLPDLLKREFPDTYTVYAGGDDLMLVAPWWQALTLAERLHDDFSAFAASNPDVTLSAGIALFDPRTPISIAASEAEERLERAKNSGRNRVCVIEETPLSWPDFSLALKQAESLNGHLRAGTLSTAGLHHLLALLDSRERVLTKQARPRDYAWRARLGYHLARNLPGGAGNPAHKDILDLFSLDAGLEDTGKSAAAGRLAITHALYRNR